MLDKIKKYPINKKISLIWTITTIALLILVLIWIFLIPKSNIIDRKRVDITNEVKENFKYYQSEINDKLK